MATIPLTVRGAERLQAELQRLKHVERPAVINAIAEARAQGDLSENAEYDAARERQGFIEGRIAELDGTLSNAQLIEPSTIDADGRAVFGATIEIEDLESGAKVTYQIVGDVEADIRSNLISVSSPVARALIGKYEGDVVEVKAPSGTREYEISSIKYLEGCALRAVISAMRENQTQLGKKTAPRWVLSVEVAALVWMACVPRP